MERNEVEEKYRWNAEEIYPSYEAWQKEKEEPEKPKETTTAKTVATGDGAYVKILVFMIAVLLTGAFLLRFLLNRMWVRKWKHR